MDIHAAIKQGDDNPPLRITCEDENGLPVPLTGASGVAFRLLAAREDVVLFEDAAVITDSDAGEVQYNWAEGDTDEPGTYRAVFRVAFPDGPMTFPTRGHLWVLIETNPEPTP